MKAQQKSSANISFSISLDSKGRVLLPAKLRNRAGFKQGDLLNISLGPDNVAHISCLHQKISSLRGIWQSGRKGKSIVDEFLAERRKEAMND